MASIQGFPTSLGIQTLQGPGRSAPLPEVPPTENTPVPLGDQLQVNFRSPAVLEPTPQPVAPDPAQIAAQQPPSESKGPAAFSNAPAALGGDFFLTGTGGLAQISSPPEVISTGPSGGGPASERSVSESHLRSLGVSGDFASENNVRFMNTGSSLFYHAHNLFEGKSVRLATTGYGEGPAGYAESTQGFFHKLGEALQGDLALVARPGAGELSDALSSVAQKQDLPILYMTDDASLGLSCQPGPDVDAEKLKAAPKFSLSDRSDLQAMTGTVANRLLVTGGDKEVIHDFIRSVDRGEPVVLLTNSQNPGPVFDEASSKLLRAPEFLAGMLTTGHESLGLSSDGSHGVPKNPVVYSIGRWLDMEAPQSPAQLVKTADNPNGLVLILDAQDPEAAQKAAAHLQRR